MKQISIDQLQANQFYWARRKELGRALVSEPSDIEIIKISTVFGTAREYWAVAVAGTDEHFDLEAYEYLHKVSAPTAPTSERADLKLVASASRTLSH